jgi:hypothetical protein
VPIRYGYFPGGTLQRILYGLTTGGEMAAEGLIGQHYKDVQQQREEERQVEEKFLPELQSRTVTPEEVSSRMSALFPHSHTDFSPSRYQPFMGSSTEALRTALEPVSHATSAATFPTPEEENIQLQSRHLPAMSLPDTMNLVLGGGPQGQPQTTPNIGVPSAFNETNPDAAGAYTGKRNALTLAEKPAVIGETGMTADQPPMHVYGAYNPFTGQTRETSRQPFGSSAQVAGQAKGAEAIAAQPGETQAKVAEAAGLLPGAVQRAGQEEQARQAVINSPAVLNARMGFERAVEEMKNDLAQARIIPPGATKEQIPGYTESDLHLSYVDLSRVDPADSKYIVRAASKAGIVSLPGPQAQLVASDDNAFQVLRTIASTLSELPANIAGLPLVDLSNRLQTDPNLAKYRAIAPSMLGIARVMAGTTGFRSNRVEMERALDAVGRPETVGYKLVQLKTIHDIIAQAQIRALVPDKATRDALIKDLDAGPR